jgi:adenylate cyclase
MATEIERKFLVIGDDWQQEVTESTHIVQGYLVSAEHLTLRVRIRGEQAFLTIKGRTQGISRDEFEYPIPMSDAQAMLEGLAQGPIIDKIRHIVPHGGHDWEIDVFARDNAGLVMAEVELASDTEHIDMPQWAGLEVSDDARYYNVNLVSNPFRNWASP